MVSPRVGVSVLSSAHGGNQAREQARKRYLHVHETLPCGFGLDFIQLSHPAVISIDRSMFGLLTQEGRLR